jgi:DNA replication and repair protein RecF
LQDPKKAVFAYYPPMFLKHLTLVNYKNFTEKTIDFGAKINCVVGPNGKGKTNVLDAIYHLALGKSYFNPQSAQNIKHGQDFFLIQGLFDKEGNEETVVCSLKHGAKKVIKRNGKIYDKLSDHIGVLPLVMISPADRDLIIEGSEVRRKLIDGIIAQSDNQYLTMLLNYQQVLTQRNALLKYFALNHTFDRETLSVYDAQLVALGTPIYLKRNEFLQEFIPLFELQYHQISQGQEKVSIQYQSQLHEGDYAAQLLDCLSKDRAVQYSSCGIHKDDLSFEIDGHPIKKFGSQGQQKSFLIALKLAQFAFIQNHTQTQPMLLLDDIFDKLDDSRVAQLVDLVNQNRFGQLFISDTNFQRTEKIVRDTGQGYTMIELL